MTKKERDIKGKFLPVGWHWFHIGNYDVLDQSLDSAIDWLELWLACPIEVDWVRNHAE